MKQSNTLVIFSLLWSLAATLPLMGQDGEENSKEEEKLRFSCLYWEGSPPEQLYYRDGEEFHPIQFKAEMRSEDFELANTSTFQLYRDAQEPIEGEPPYDLLATSNIPASEQVLFLIIPFGESTVPEIKYRVVAMDDSLTAFPPGTFRFANFTPQTLLVKCGETTAKIPANKITVIGSKDSPSNGFVPFVIGNSAGKTVFGTRIFGQPSGRELIFISPPAQRGAMPRVKFISQLIAPPKAEPNEEE